jgi:hypothetical protein
VTLIPGDGEVRFYGDVLHSSDQELTPGIGPEISEAVKAIYAAAKVIICPDKVTPPL